MTNSPYQPYHPDPQSYTQAAAPQYAQAYSQPPRILPEPRDSHSTDPRFVPVYGSAITHPNSSLVLAMGIAGWFFFPLSIVGLVMGIKAHKDVTSNPGTYSSGGILFAGIVLSAFNVGLVVLAVLFFAFFMLLGFAGL